MNRSRNTSDLWPHLHLNTLLTNFLRVCYCNFRPVQSKDPPAIPKIKVRPAGPPTFLDRAKRARFGRNHRRLFDGVH